ncbi:MAG: 3-methylcrotonyl-CoA carboxylase [Pararhodobacter sp.]|nr:3-methylcrotonyl-CoA carboxylase [Pararhodobacter sp.]
MRLVDAEGDFTAALRTARSEANGAFGDDRVLIEKAIIRPRHIEIQVLGDRYGHAIHLGERDCSVQRRHQKLIEEAPSPAVSDALRQRMGAAATAAVQAIGYEGAGTLEFLLDDAGNFYFMEMNTRLQVEHPVTEAITGLDLVALQLRIAAGEPLDIAQSDVTFAGHAIELRLCAEDTGRNFMPQAGTMALWRPPSDLRVEHALEDGAVISPHYDSMIAKIIAHGATRDEARRRLLGGLNHMAALGVTTNRQMLARVLDHPVFARGGATTAFLTEQAHAITGKSEKDAQKARALACVLLRLTDSAMAAGGKAHALCHGFPAPLRVEFDDELVTATLVTERDGSFLVDRDGVQTRLWLDMTGPGALRLRIGTWQGSAAFARQGTTLYLSLDGGDHTARDLTFLPEVALQVAGGDGLLKASMSGQVTAVHVSPGDQIVAGQQLVTIEAMKMEHPHMLRASGTVGELLVKPGDQVSMGQTLLTLAD